MPIRGTPLAFHADGAERGGSTAAWRLLERKPRTMPISVRRTREGSDSGEVERRWEAPRPEQPAIAAALAAVFGVVSGFAEEGARRPLPPLGYAQTVDRAALTSPLRLSITRRHVVIALRHAVAY